MCSFQSYLVCLYITLSNQAMIKSNAFLYVIEIFKSSFYKSVLKMITTRNKPSSHSKKQVSCNGVYIYGHVLLIWIMMSQMWDTSFMQWIKGDPKSTKIPVLWGSREGERLLYLCICMQPYSCIANRLFPWLEPVTYQSQRNNGWRTNFLVNDTQHEALAAFRSSSSIYNF